MSDPTTGTSLDGRAEQMFPQLSPAEINRLSRFGERRPFKAGEMLVRAGEQGHGLTVLLSGEVEILQHDETGR
jgi:thioredoxin reductase (NADPH)